MNAIEALKTACQVKPVVSFDTLLIGDYQITSFKRVQTKFGDRIRLELQEYIVYLPPRFSHNLTDEIVNELNTSIVIMTFRGKDPVSKNRLLLDFDVIETSDSNELVARPAIPPTPPPSPQPPHSQEHSFDSHDGRVAHTAV